MDKIKLNNQVVLMRKYVKQAKVHTINKLVKQVKLLQNRKGNEVQVQKAKRKAEKFLEEISILKKIKPDSVSKVALSKDKDWKVVLLEKNSTLGDRCIAMLATYGPVQKEVEVFHNSNKDLVAKIPDLVKQWEEKDRFLKKSPKKISNLEKQKNNTSMQNIKVPEGLLNDLRNQSVTNDSGNNKSVDEKTGSFLIDSSHKLKRGEKRLKNAIKQKQSSIEASKNSVSVAKISEESDNGEDLRESAMEVGKSDNVGENAMEIEKSDNVKYKSKNMLDEDENESENDTDSDAENESKDECESNDENESNIAFAKEENGNFKHEDIHENELEVKGDKIKGNAFKKLQLSKDLEVNSNKSPNEKHSVLSDNKNLNISCVSLLKTGSKSGENKLKAITVLNLDDLGDLDEIPVNNSVEDVESSEEEEGTDEHSINDESQNDPFFLGHDEAVSTENRLVDSPMKRNFVSKDQVFDRKERSIINESKYEKNFHKPLNRSQFSSRNSFDYKEKRNSKTFKKDKFVPKSDRSMFQDKSKNNYDKNNFKNRFEPYKQNNFERVNSSNSKVFKKKTFSGTHGNNKHNNSNDLYHRNRGDNSFEKSKNLQKGDLNVKPLHPSWEAQRKQKELKNIPYQGKKVVFED